MQPLQGRIVLDLSRYLPGPFLTRVLVDLGAQVVKIEQPGGDPIRYLPPLRSGVSSAFATLNAGKRSLVLNLKQTEGLAAFHALAKRADVVVESFRPGVLSRLGAGYDELKAINPKIVLCSISGYGQNGPKSKSPGHDLNYMALSGALSLLSPTSSLPLVPGMQLADLAGGAQSAAIGVLAALLERERTSQGCHLDISMTRCMLPLAHIASLVSGGGVEDDDGRGLLTGGVPCYGVYETKDGAYMALGALEPAFFDAFCRAAGCEHLSGKGLLQGEEGLAVTQNIQALFLQMTQAEWVTRFMHQDVCCEPVQAVSDAVGDAAVGGLISQTKSHDVVRVGFTSDALEGSLEVPALGGEPKEICRDLGVPSSVFQKAYDVGALT